MTTNFSATGASPLEALQPHTVWAHFATLCAIPRPSYREAALIQHLIEWAQARGIETIVDGAGNLILKKPASPGCESMPGAILQGHLDMVCQSNAGTVHDFERDAINAVVRDGWVVAENTTLGADNGIGVALALAALEEPGLVHPPIEVLLTVNEESGMDGARGLAPGTLQGKTLINLDTEEWGHFYLGCAGGVDVEVRGTVETEKLEASASTPSPTLPLQGGGRSSDYALVRFEVSGLRGGHSGIDTHLGRGNAIKLLAEALRDLAAHTDLRLIEFNGGSARNAIPREAFATCALPAGIAASIDEWAQHRHESWRERFAAADANVSFACRHYDMPEDATASTPTLALPLQGGGNESAGMAIANAERDRLLAFLDTSVNGVSRVSSDFHGVTDTSSNLGVVALEQGTFKATFKVRSLQGARADALADKLVAHAASYGLRAWKDGAYPGWTPNPASPLLALCRRVYTEQFGQPAGLQVIHAGLECGLLAASHPQLDMISFGPDIRGAHAPGERVEIASVGRCWTLLKAVLQALA
ncbi:MAG: aminoacyl-histidine dipeptidase [Gallionella sp.]|nr:aminoacyl-histidine dipeptidase [Gallionella sp.]MCK9354183.1 aminoacyl-histidine dipeptidase [Gallionella sp.]